MSIQFDHRDAVHATDSGNDRLASPFASLVMDLSDYRAALQAHGVAHSRGEDVASRTMRFDPCAGRRVRENTAKSCV